jgi:DNA (cytosine-5)-methyltransferase 1
MTYYNELDPYAAQWLRNLGAAGHIAAGRVDNRSIKEVQSWEITENEQAHFFAGVGVWSYALRLAGVPDSLPVWTGSCPCQPFSQAGRRKGNADERHLWPDWFKLIKEFHPPVIFGEQVAGPDGLRWLDSVFADLEGEDYAVAAADTCAAGVGAPHLRQRLYFMAYSTRKRHAGFDALLQRYKPGRVEENRVEIAGGCASSGLADDDSIFGDQGGAVAAGGNHRGNAEIGGGFGGYGFAGALGDDDDDARPQGRIVGWHSPGERASRAAGLADPWESDWLWCRDKKYRPVGPGTFPLAHGTPSRVGRVCAYGNALVAQQAAQFVMAAFDAMDLCDMLG